MLTFVNLSLEVISELSARVLRIECRHFFLSKYIGVLRLLLSTVCMCIYSFSLKHKNNKKCFLLKFTSAHQSLDLDLLLSIKVQLSCLFLKNIETNRNYSCQLTTKKSLSSIDIHNQPIILSRHSLHLH